MIATVRHDAAQPATTATLQLRILATTDVHGQILSYDYYRNRPQFGQGLAQAAHLIASARAQVPGALLLDNGDFLQGSALTERAALRMRRRSTHPAIAAFNALKYDVVALGNHEFNYGLDVLTAALTDAEFAVVSANVAVEAGEDGPLSDRHLVRPYVILKRMLPDQDGQLHPLSVGVLGLTPPQIMLWDRHHLSGRLSVRPMLAAAQAFVPQMRAEGADVVICLAHTGIAETGAGERRDPAAVDAEAIEVAAIPGVDVVVAGHSHLVFPNSVPHADPRVEPAEGRLAGKPCVLPGHSGSHLGVIDLWLEGRPGQWQIRRSRAEAVSTSEVVAGLTPQDIRDTAGPLREAVSEDHRATLAWLRREIATTRIPLSTHFATLVDSQATRMVAAALTAHVERGLAGGPHEGIPVIASVSPFRSGGRGGPMNYTDIPAGPLTLRNIYDLYPYPNRLVAKLVTGADLRSRLELGTALFRQLQPGAKDQELLDPAVPAFSFEILSGLTYQIDLSRPLMSRIAPLASEQGGWQGRIIDLACGGRPVAANDRFILITNNFLTAAAMHPGAPIVLDDHSLCADVIALWASETGEIGPLPGPGWQLAPIPDTSILVRGGAGANEHIADIAAYRPEYLGLTSDGFQSFRLHL